MSTILTNHQRAADAFAELQHNISLDMCSGRVRMSIRWTRYRWVCRCTGGGMMGSEFLDQVSDWPKDAVDPPTVRRSVNRWHSSGSRNDRVHGWRRSLNRLIPASGLAVILFGFSDLVPAFCPPV